MTQKQLIVTAVIILLACLFVFIMQKIQKDSSDIQSSDTGKRIYKADNLPDSIYMSEDKFWKLIATSSHENYERQQKKLAASLSAEEPAEIIKFENRFHALQDRAYDWKLWGAAYIINGGCSDDCFIDFRSWLIGQGQDVYEAALENPESLTEIKIDPDNWEGIQYVATSVYEEKTKREMPVANLPAKSEPSGQEWKEEELHALFPKLSKKYSY